MSEKRFRDAQKDDYEIALSEIKNGRWGPREACFVGRGDATERILPSAAFQAGGEVAKSASTRMWYIFPQIHGLGFSSISEYYSIKDIQEAKDYLTDPVLGSHLTEICQALLDLDSDDPHQIFGSPDDLKLLSCMTLFEKAVPDNKVFPQVIEKFYGGRRDRKTLDILKNDEATSELTDREVYEI